MPTTQNILIIPPPTNDLNWEKRIGHNPVYDFEFIKIDGKVWINKIDTYSDYRGQDYGTQVIIEALKIHKEIYVCTADKGDIQRLHIDGDCRYTNDWNPDLIPFVIRLIQKGILKKEWVINPCKPNGGIVEWLHKYLRFVKSAEPLDEEQMKYKKIVVDFLNSLDKKSEKKHFLVYVNNFIAEQQRLWKLRSEEHEEKKKEWEKFRDSIVKIG